MSLPPKPNLRRGFTLTELLVVIAIIAILASLGTVAVMRALATARATAIKTELDQIDAAMKRYKDTYGSYPPCDLRNPATNGQLRQHIAMAFPRYNLTRLANDLAAAGIDTTNFRPDQALVFWLQGFGADPTSPILSVEAKQINTSGVAVGNPQKRTNNFFEFDQTRLAGKEIGGTPANPAPSYFPVNARYTTSTNPAKTFPVWDAGAPPVVYFDSRLYEFAAPVGPSTEARPNQFNQSGAVIFTDAGVATPYWHDRNGNGSTCGTDDFSSQETWANPDSYQLIAAGGDGKYGAVNPPNFYARRYPTGINYDLVTMTDDDNATNFSSAAKLGDDIP